MSDQFLLDLRAEVAAAARRVDDRTTAVAPVDLDRRRAKRRRWPLSAAAAVLLVALLAAAYLMGSRPEPPAVRVDREGDQWIVRWDDGEPDPQELRRVGEELGVDIEVRQVPVGAYGVGRLTAYSTSGAYATPGPILDDGQGFRISNGQGEAIRLDIGRPAEPGETWAASVPATGPGSALACQPLLGQPLDRTVAALVDSGLTVTALEDVGSSSALLRDPSPQDLADAAELTVVALDQLAPDQVWIKVAPQGTDAVRISEPEGC